MTVESVRINSIYPHPYPHYEWVEATVDFAVDPEHLANQRIANLKLARRHVDGLVRFDADLCLLRPIDGGSGNLLFVVPNRALPGSAPFLKGGFLLNRGWTIASCGWQSDVLHRPTILGLTAPRADIPPGWIRLHWRGDNASNEQLLSESPSGVDSLSDVKSLFGFTERPTIDVDDPDAVLSVHHSPEGPSTIIPRGSWRFTDPTHVAVDGGFKPFHFYELVYRTSQATVVGCGLLAIRDMMSHLRADGIDHSLAYGVSDAGRLLRKFLWDGLNIDETGARVFDGVFSDLASASRGGFNRRCAQPSVTQVNGLGNLPPFGHVGLLAHQRRVGAVPKAILANSRSDYWNGDGALPRVDPFADDDLPEDPDARTCPLPGTEHFGGSRVDDALRVATSVHSLDIATVHRALLVALEKWVAEGVEPPLNRLPHTSTHTAVSTPVPSALDREPRRPRTTEDQIPGRPHAWSTACWPRIPSARRRRCS